MQKALIISLERLLVVDNRCCVIELHWRFHHAYAAAMWEGGQGRGGKEGGKGSTAALQQPEVDVLHAVGLPPAR